MKITVIFDQSCSQWSPTKEYNYLFIKGQQKYFNELLQKYGFVFVNDVVVNFGLPRTMEGQTHGWIFSEQSNPVIDFAPDDIGDGAVRMTFDVEDIMHVFDTPSPLLDIHAKHCKKRLKKLHRNLK